MNLTAFPQFDLFGALCATMAVPLQPTFLTLYFYEFAHVAIP